MFGRIFVGILLACALAASLAYTIAAFDAKPPQPQPPRPAGPEPEKPAPPTIVLMIADDHFYGDFGFAGNPHAHTPAIDRLAAEGALFPVAHVGMSRCRPSMACLLTGRYPHQHGVYYNANGPPLADSRKTLPMLLKQAGYACWAGGKYWEGDPERLGFVGLMPGLVRNHQRDLEAFLESVPNQPAFIWWAPALPHYPFNAPKRFLDRASSETLERPSFVPPEDGERWRKSQGRLLANVAWLDEGARRLRAILYRQGRLQNTLIVFLADNGFLYGLPSKGSPGEAGLRTPVILWDPHRIPGGTKVNRLISTLDVVPTILEWAGIQPPDDLAGLGLWPLIEGNSVRSRNALFGAAYNFEPSDSAQPAPAHDVYALYARTERWKYIVYLTDITNDLQARSLGHSSFTAPDWDAFENFDPESNGDRRLFFQPDFSPRDAGQEELFDLGADPFELRDLAGSPEVQNLKQSLRRRTFEWWYGTGGGPLPIGPEDF